MQNEKSDPEVAFFVVSSGWKTASDTVSGAGNETRTRDLNLGKVALYQLSYSRLGGEILQPNAGLSTALS